MLVVVVTPVAVVTPALAVTLVAVAMLVHQVVAWRKSAVPQRSQHEFAKMV